MIKKLRRKFAIINMSLVAVILCVVLGMFCFTRIHAFRAESEIAMRHSVHNTGKALSEEDLPHLFEISVLLLRSHFLCQKKKNLPDF